MQNLTGFDFPYVLDILEVVRFVSCLSIGKYQGLEKKKEIIETQIITSKNN